ASCNPPERLIWKSIANPFGLRAVPIRSCSRWGLPCRRCYHRRGGLLPHPFTLTPSSLRLPCAMYKHNKCTEDGAVYFLWHYPWGRPRRALPGTVFPWSPDFPHLPPFGIGQVRLPDRLTARV